MRSAPCSGLLNECQELFAVGAHYVPASCWFWPPYTFLDPGSNDCRWALGSTPPMTAPSGAASMVTSRIGLPGASASSWLVLF